MVVDNKYKAVLNLICFGREERERISWMTSVHVKEYLVIIIFFVLNYNFFKKI